MVLICQLPLGINCDIESDKLGFKVNLGDKPYTRRGMHSMISKIYDPLGLGKRILEELFKNNFSWDEQVSVETIEEWD